MHTIADHDTKWTPPYVSFRTILNLLTRMADNGIPPQIDRSFLSGSEGGKTQVITALRSLGLVEQDGRVTELLIDLVQKPQERPALIAGLLREFFPKPVDLGLVNATQRQLEDAFAEYGIRGDTMRKAIAFYLRAAEYADVPLSPNFRTPSITATGTRPRKSRPSSTTQDPDPATTHLRNTQTGIPGTIHPALAGLLQELRQGDPEWTQTKRNQFMAAFGSILDLCYPPRPEGFDDEDGAEEFEDEEE
jgi:hypothetical protein